VPAASFTRRATRRPLGRRRLAAPRAPGRPADLQLDVAHLRVAVEPHVCRVEPPAPSTLSSRSADPRPPGIRSPCPAAADPGPTVRPRPRRRSLARGGGRCRAWWSPARRVPGEQQGDAAIMAIRFMTALLPKVSLVRCVGAMFQPRAQRRGDHGPGRRAPQLNLAWYSRCRPAHLPANSAPTMRHTTPE